MGIGSQFGEPGRGVVIGSLCTGYAGLDLGVLAAFGGGRIAWVADPDPHVRAILDRRLPGVPNHGDITGIDWSDVEPVTVITAGFPCQDISAAGRGAGIRKGTRSGLWHQVVDAIRHLRPALVVVENVAALRWRKGGLDAVLGDLAEIGYDAHWASVRASDVGAPHRRERVFLLGYRAQTGFAAWSANTAGTRLEDDQSCGIPSSDAAWARPAQRGFGSSAYPTGAGCERRRESACCTESGRTSGEPDRRDDDIPADASGMQPQRRGGPCPLAQSQGPSSGACDQRQRDGDATVDRRSSAADAPFECQPQQPYCGEGLQFRPGPGTGRRDHLGDSAEGTDQLVRGDSGLAAEVDWGVYEPAIRRWESALGVAAPHPTEPGRNGRPRLAPVFVEWVMGLDVGWVTDVDIPRTGKLRALGNGVVPQQAAYAVGLMLADLVALDHFGGRQEAVA